jgi:hypothetical protein
VGVAQLPTPNAREHRAKVDADIAAREGPAVKIPWGKWADLLEAVSGEYPTFKKSEEEALKLVGSVAKDMDDPREPAPKRWTFRARDQLGRLVDLCPVKKWGLEGHRFWSEQPDDPKDLLVALETVRLLARDLWCAGAEDVPAIPEPRQVQKPTAPVSGPASGAVQADRSPAD